MLRNQTSLLVVVAAVVADVVTRIEYYLSLRAASLETRRMTFVLQTKREQQEKRCFSKGTRA